MMTPVVRFIGLASARSAPYASRDGLGDWFTLIVLVPNGPAVPPAFELAPTWMMTEAPVKFVSPEYVLFGFMNWSVPAPPAPAVTFPLAAPPPGAGSCSTSLMMTSELVTALNVAVLPLL